MASIKQQQQGALPLSGLPELSLQRGLYQSNPAKLVTNPKTEKRLPNFLSVDDVFTLIEKPDGIGFLYARDRAILELLYSSGLRVSEISELNADDINTKEGLVKVRGKGKKERILTMAQRQSMP